MDLVLRGSDPLPPGWIGPGDDAAVLPLGDAVTVDALVEGVHFDDRLDAYDVGFKALAVSVSDLAAMGARPRWAVLALSTPERADHLAWVAALGEGLAAAC
ncbi:MAG TPA: AIR synthase related protein, partial [Myxococcota bacterium]|nr:AIR synthase related protein [Myxococcota bacterium]